MGRPDGPSDQRAAAVGAVIVGRRQGRGTGSPAPARAAPMASAAVPPIGTSSAPGMDPSAAPDMSAPTPERVGTSAVETTGPETAGSEAMASEPTAPEPPPPRRTSCTLPSSSAPLCSPGNDPGDDRADARPGTSRTTKTAHATRHAAKRAIRRIGGPPWSLIRGVSDFSLGRTQTPRGALRANPDLWPGIPNDGRHRLRAIPPRAAPPSPGWCIAAACAYVPGFRSQQARATSRRAGSAQWGGKSGRAGTACRKHPAYRDGPVAQR